MASLLPLLVLARQHRVARNGLEATGGYERDVVECLRTAARAR
jgi:hypothetical protein